MRNWTALSRAAFDDAVARAEAGERILAARREDQLARARAAREAEAGSQLFPELVPPVPDPAPLPAPQPGRPWPCDGDVALFGGDL